MQAGLVDALVNMLNGGRAALDVKITRDTELFPADFIGKAPPSSGVGNLSTYKDVCNLATEADPLLNTQGLGKACTILRMEECLRVMAIIQTCQSFLFLGKGSTTPHGNIMHRFFLIICFFSEHPYVCVHFF